ncbi:RNA-directed DNA polymerase [Bacteroides thetaiotaomicron]|uniref:RNA-directed DNA polymerase n=1 Tax=Bacteroides thetaiotaomicron TaxID=818 RepID=UPI0039C1A622
MESRNITLTICGEWLDFSPRDRKAVCKIDDLFKLTGNIPLVSYPLYNLIPEIISDENLERSFKRVMANLRNADARNGNRAMPKTIIDGIECSPRMIRYVTNKGKIFETLKNQIGNGTFRIKNLKSFLTEDGPKVRTVQAPSVIERIGSNAIMEPLENRLSSLLIKTTAASIQGRGPHGLFHQIQAAMAENPNLKYYYQSDYKGYYDSINHETLISIIKRYVGDPLLLPILENFVKALYPDGECGISKGLRSSQFLGNLYHNDIDHRMIDVHGARYYFRFCDDIFILGESKRELWRLRDCLHIEADKMGLTIKSSERVALISAGMDALGYVNYGSHTLLRKRIKVNAARKLSKLKSRKRRQQIIGSFKGMACHADCKHLFYILTKKNMKKFSEMGVTYTPADGKKRFPGKVTRLSDIVNIPIEIHDFETGIDTKEGENRYLVSFRNPAKQEWGKFFTASAEMKGILDQVSDIEDGFPFETIIKGEVFDGGKRKYNFT